MSVKTYEQMANILGLPFIRTNLPFSGLPCAVYYTYETGDATVTATAEQVCTTVNGKVYSLLDDLNFDTLSELESIVDDEILFNGPDEDQE